MKRKKALKKIISCFYSLFIIFFVMLYIKNNPESYASEKVNASVTNNLSVHFIDVDQGDSAFIELPNGETMLIDVGEASRGKTVVDYIKNLGYSKIDYVVGTHPHTDHIGGLSEGINTFDIGKIYMPKVVSTSETYENLLNTISLKGLKIESAKADVNIIQEDNLLVNILSPTKDKYSDLNNYSAVIKVTFNNVKFLFMGDAEKEIENEIDDVSADVIKIGHHGSNTSSSEDFVKRVKARYAIISVGNNNKYNHPYKEILNRWQNSGAKIFRTDLNGTIVVNTDGNKIDIKTEK